MSSFRRFFREHLWRYLPQNLAGSLLLMLAGLCQGALVTTLKFVFEDNLGMGAPKGADAFAMAGRAKVWVDGGFSRGTDVVKALCLGARAVLVGRAYAYGLAAAGETGVTRAIEILRSDVVRTLKLLGVDSTAKLDRSFVDVPSEWLTRVPR